MGWVGTYLGGGQPHLEFWQQAPGQPTGYTEPPPRMLRGGARLALKTWWCRSLIVVIIIPGIHIAYIFIHFYPI